MPRNLNEIAVQGFSFWTVLTFYNYLLTYDSYVPLYEYNRFHRGEWITWVSGGEGALVTLLGP
jgi:hypothetical protein